MTTAPCQNLPFIPRDGAGPIFSAPWEARVFGLVVDLAESGHFDWNEWATTFSAEIARCEHARHGHSNDYYACWLAAAETLLARKGILTPSEVGQSVAMTLESWPHPDHTAKREPILRVPPLA